MSVEIDISARHGQLSADTRDRISDKVEKLTRYFDRLTAMHVLVDMEQKGSVSVEVRVSAEHTNDFVSLTEADSVFAALDGAVHKVEQQIRKHKEKLTGHRSTASKHIETPAPEELDG